MKILKFVALALTIFSPIWCIINVIDVIKKRDWVITTAKVTFIGLPQGNVFGTFTDVNNITYENVYMYQDNKFTQMRAFKKGTNSEPYIGTKVKIIYNPDNLTDKYQRNIEKYRTNYFPYVFLITSIIFLWACMRKKHNNII